MTVEMLQGLFDLASMAGVAVMVHYLLHRLWPQ
jgi:hypothetical protein